MSNIVEEVKQQLKQILKEKGNINILATTSRVLKISDVVKQLEDKSGEFYEVYNSLGTKNAEIMLSASLSKIKEIVSNIVSSPFKDATPPKHVLMTRPHYEPATNILYKWEEPLVQELKSRNIDTYILDGKVDTRENFEKYVKDADTVFIFGHGNYSQVAGHNNEIILDNKNVHLLKDKQVIVLACMSAMELGVASVVLGGANYYYGYKHTFVFATPPYDEVFKDVALIPFFEVLGGGSLEKIYAIQAGKYLASVGKIPLEMFYVLIPALIWDLLGLEIDRPI